MANKHMKNCSPFLAIREMQIKTTMRVYRTSLNGYHQTKTSAGEDVGKKIL
jgi:hypothetical protein